MNKILISIGLIFSIFNIMSCQKDSAQLHSEILETTYQKKLHEEAPEYNVKQERRLIYKNDLLVEERISFFRGKKTTNSKYVYSYDSDKKIKSKKYLSTDSGELVFEEIYSYDSKGFWNSVKRTNEKGRVLDFFKVSSRSPSGLIAESTENSSTVKITVTNDYRDSLIQTQGNAERKSNPRISEFKKNNFGDIIYENSYNTIGDSLLLLKKTKFHYLNNSKKWNYNIAEIRAINWQNKELILRDSVVREEVMDSKKIEINKNNLCGTWDMNGKNQTFLKLINSQKFEIIHGGKVRSGGNWQFNRHHKEFTLIFKKGDPKGEKRKCQIIELYEDLLIIKEDDIKRTLVKKK